MTRRHDLIAAFALFVLTFLLYAATAAPEITSEDAGDLVTGVATLGIVHPPGYPLYTMLGHVFVKLPIPGSVAYRVALFSGLWGAATVAFLFLAFRLAIGSFGASLFAASSFAVSCMFWSQCTIPEIYTLNTFFSAFLLYLALRFRLSDNDRYLYLFSVILGLALTNSYALVLLAAPGLLLAAWPARRRAKSYLTCGAFVLGGLAPYLYLVVQSARHEALAYNFAHVSSLNDVIAHVTRRHYFRGIDASGGTSADKLAYAAEFLKWLVFQYFLTTPLLVGGLVGAFRGKWPYRYAFLLCALGTSLGLVLTLNRPSDAFSLANFRSFPIPSYLFLAAFIALGARTALEGAPRISRSAKWVVLTALLVGQVAWNFPYASHRYSRSAKLWALSSLRSLPPQAILVTSGDETFLFNYLHVVENVRPDIAIYDRNSSITKDNLYAPSVIFKMPLEVATKIQLRVEGELIEKQPRPVYFTVNDPLVKNGIPATMTAFFFTRASDRGPEVISLEHELSERFLDDFLTTLPRAEPWTDRLRSDGLASLTAYGVATKQIDFGKARMLIDKYGYARNAPFLISTAQYLMVLKDKETALAIFDQADTVDATAFGLDPLRSYCKLLVNARSFEKAERVCSKELGQSTGCNADPHYNLGVLYAATNRREKAIAHLEQAQKCDPNHVLSADVLRRLRAMER